MIQFDLARVSGGPGDPEESGEPVNFRPVYEFLTRFDARTRLEIGRLLNAPVAIDQLHMEASLDNGILELTHAGVLLAGSPVTATALLDEGEDCIRLNSELHLDHLSLDLLNRFIDRERDVGGTLEALELGAPVAAIRRTNTSSPCNWQFPPAVSPLRGTGMIFRWHSIHSRLISTGLSPECYRSTANFWVNPFQSQPVSVPSNLFNRIISGP